jgi:hypothetical protein
LGVWALGVGCFWALGGLGRWVVLGVGWSWALGGLGRRRGHFTGTSIARLEALIEHITTV